MSEITPCVASSAQERASCRNAKPCFDVATGIQALRRSLPLCAEKRASRRRLLSLRGAAPHARSLRPMRCCGSPDAGDWFATNAIADSATTRAVAARRAGVTSGSSPGQPRPRPLLLQPAPSRKEQSELVVTTPAT